MATLKAQIENLTGGTLASTVYDDWILACTRTLIDILKPEDLESGSTSVTVSQSAGLDITLYRIWTVLCNGYSAIPRITGSETQMTDSSSFYKATVFTPAYIIKAGTLRCYDGRSIAVDANNTSVALVGAGSGYSINDFITMNSVGGLVIQVLTITVPGGVSTFSVYSYGTAQAAVTAGSTTAEVGSGATFTISIAPVSQMLGIAYPSSIDSSTATEVSSIPDMLQYAVVLYAAIQAKANQLSANAAGFTALLSLNVTNVSSITIPSLDISTQLSTLATNLVTNEDIELAMGNIKDIETKVAKWREYDYKHDFEGQVTKLTLELATIKAKLEVYSAQLLTYQEGIKQLQAEYNNIISMYLGRDVSKESK